MPGCWWPDKDPYALAGGHRRTAARRRRRADLRGSRGSRLAELDLGLGGATDSSACSVPLAGRGCDRGGHERASTSSSPCCTVPTRWAATRCGCARCWRAAGIASRIYVELDDSETSPRPGHYTRYAADAAAGDVLVYQFATASDMAAWLVRVAREPLVVNYHNVTPPEYYAPWDNAMARHQLRAQEELRALARRAVLGLAVSAYNEADQLN